MKSRKTKTKSEIGFFKPKKDKCEDGHNQTVNVNVTIEQADDGIAECLSGCFSACLGLGKKAAGAG